MNDYKTVPISEHTDEELNNMLVMRGQIIKEQEGVKPKGSKYWKAVESKRQAMNELRKRGHKFDIDSIAAEV
jgi:hypothetical protein